MCTLANTAEGAWMITFPFAIKMRLDVLQAYQPKITLPAVTLIICQHSVSILMVSNLLLEVSFDALPFSAVRLA